MATGIASSARAVVADIHAKIRSGDRRTATALAAAVFCAAAPLDIPQLLLVILGALACAMLQPVEVPRRPAKLIPPSSPKVMDTGVAPAPRSRLARAVVGAHRPAAPKLEAAQQVPATSFRPVLAPKLAASGWEAQVEELVATLLPTAASALAVERLGARVRQTVRRLAPEAEVTAFASGGVLRCSAFGVAVPDVDIVVSCPTEVLASRLSGKRMDGRQVQKTALRALADRLNATGDFKFRRSAFAADEPKVTMLAVDGASAVPIDLAVNCSTPLRNAALITQCGRLDAHARALILLVRRWARDRGICHAAKGHLPPYCWTLLAVYFLQAGMEEGDAVLPPLRGLEAICREAPDGSAARAATPSRKTRSVGTLFRDFVAFYGGFDAKREAVSVRSGRRAAPSLRLPLHVVLREDGVASGVAPSIEDPFEPSRNLAAGMSEHGLARWREELARAASLLSCGGEGASLAELLEPWSPPEQADAQAEQSLQ